MHMFLMYILAFGQKVNIVRNLTTLI